jgi:hypothetical protein
MSSQWHKKKHSKYFLYITRNIKGYHAANNAMASNVGNYLYNSRLQLPS